MQYEIREYKGPGGDVVIPDGIREIQNGAFANRSDITSVWFPESLEIIGEYAFLGCNGLTELRLPAQTSSIGRYAFMFCNSLRYARIDGENLIIRDYAFRQCDALRQLDLPENISVIGSGFVADCLALREIRAGRYVIAGNDLARLTDADLRCGVLRSAVMMLSREHFSSRMAAKHKYPLLWSMHRAYPERAKLTEYLRAHPHPLCTELVRIGSIPDIADLIGEGWFTRQHMDEYLALVPAQSTELYAMLLHEKERLSGFADAGGALRL